MWSLCAVPVIVYETLVNTLQDDSYATAVKNYVVSTSYKAMIANLQSHLIALGQEIAANHNAFELSGAPITVPHCCYRWVYENCLDAPRWECGYCFRDNGLFKESVDSLGTKMVVVEISCKEAKTKKNANSYQVHIVSQRWLYPD